MRICLLYNFKLSPQFTSVNTYLESQTGDLIMLIFLWNYLRLELILPRQLGEDSKNVLTKMVSRWRF